MQTLAQYFPKRAKEDIDELFVIVPPKAVGTALEGDTLAEAPAADSSTKVAGSRVQLKYYSEEIKAKATSYALVNGIAAALRKHPDIKRTTLRGWVDRARRAQVQASQVAAEGLCAVPVNLSEVLVDRRVNNGRTLPQVVFDRVYDRFKFLRAAGMVITRSLLRLEVLTAASELVPDILADNGGWLTCSLHMMQRLERELNVTRRAGTTAKRGYPPLQPQGSRPPLARGRTRHQQGLRPHPHAPDTSSGASLWTHDRIHESQTGNAQHADRMHGDDCWAVANVDPQRTSSRRQLVLYGLRNQHGTLAEVSGSHPRPEHRSICRRP